ncbi:hypothetical protein C0992_000268 [Termitomyces sp. T32_za158]|nr:hypothetical protein C0992_000268 [Termitomyces sp. T32_za158]
MLPSVYIIGDTVVWDGWPTQISTVTENGNDESIQQQQGQGQNATIMVLKSSLSRRIGAALLAPWISNRMGALLLGVSRHSAFLRRILAVKTEAPESQGLFGQLQRMSGILPQSDISGYSMWTEANPVWWRNTLGFGLFVVIKDAIELLYLWRAKRKFDRRHEGNNHFSPVDIDDFLDLASGTTRPASPLPKESQGNHTLWVNTIEQGRLVQSVDDDDLQQFDHILTVPTTYSYPYQAHMELTLAPMPILPSSRSSESIDDGNFRQDLDQSVTHQVVYAQTVPGTMIGPLHPVPHRPRLHHRQWTTIPGPSPDTLIPDSIIYNSDSPRTHPMLDHPYINLGKIIILQ